MTQTVVTGVGPVDFVVAAVNTVLNIRAGRRTPQPTPEDFVNFRAAGGEIVQRGSLPFLQYSIGGRVVSPQQARHIARRSERAADEPPPPPEPPAPVEATTPTRPTMPPVTPIPPQDVTQTPGRPRPVNRPPIRTPGGGIWQPGGPTPNLPPQVPPPINPNAPPQPPRIDIPTRYVPPDVFGGPAPRPGPIVDADIVTGGVSILGRILGGVGMILWPSSTADDDTTPDADVWSDTPGGPASRPVNRRPPQDVPDTLPPPMTIPEVVTVSAPRVESPTVGNYQVPRWDPVLSAPIPTPLPTTPASTWTPPGLSDVLPYVLPLVGSYVFSGTGKVPRTRTSSPPSIPPLTPDYTDAPSSPLSPGNPCNCPSQSSEPKDQDRSKRKRKKCTNPITAKRKTTRGGVKYQTITRKIQCQA